MGPRHLSRGIRNHADGIIHIVVASMGPRHLSRGIGGGVGQEAACLVMLQWGHGI